MIVVEVEDIHQGVGLAAARLRLPGCDFDSVFVERARDSGATVALIEVPNTGINDYHIIELIGGILIISGIGVVAYYVKKKRK